MKTVTCRLQNSNDFGNDNDFGDDVNNDNVVSIYLHNNHKLGSLS